MTRDESEDYVGAAGTQGVAEAECESVRNQQGVGGPDRFTAGIRGGFIRGGSM